MNRLLKKTLLHLSSQAGVSAVSAGSAVVVLKLCGYEGRFVYEIAAALVLIRLLLNLGRGPRPILTTYFVRKRFTIVLREETKAAVGLIATCYVMQWPATQTTIGLLLGVNLVLQVGMLYLSKLIRSLLVRHDHRTPGAARNRQVIIVGTGAKGKAVADMILRSPELDTLLMGFLDYRRGGLWRYRDIPLLGHPDLFPTLVSTCQIDALVVAVEPEDMALTQSLYETAEKMGVTVCLLPNIYDAHICKARPGYINGTPVVVYRAVPESRAAEAAKLAVDKVGAMAGLVLTLPVMLAAALAIKLESRGPIFFKQTRSGLNGRRFELLKLRTMCNGAEKLKEKLRHRNEMSGPVFKIKNDPRVTSVGRILRKFSIDELPQFINVLRGDMSLVGPRPPLPKEVARYEPWQHRKLSVRPGVTCLWQVNGRNEINFEEWMRLDLRYIDNWSLWLDTKLILKTIPAVMKGRGAS
jgi:exopolysaccharide biosynthesis polyprenyl glycosylphosphotransferase